MTNVAIGFIVSLLIAAAYGVLFTNAYPLVKIDGGLALGFAIAGLLTYAAGRAAVRLFRGKSAPAGDAAGPPTSSAGSPRE